MKASVFDTYVTKKDGSVMHFDVIVPVNTPEEQVYAFGKEYLKTRGQEDQPLTAKECTFCHIEEATPSLIHSLESKGHFILEMHGCG